MKKLLSQFSAQKLYNSMLIPPEECGLKEERYADNNIIISDSALLHPLPPQLKNTTS